MKLINEKKGKEIVKPPVNDNSQRLVWFNPWYKIPETNVNLQFPFSFNEMRSESIPMIFIGTAVVAPFAISIILKIIFGNFGETGAALPVLLNSFISWIVAGIGCYLIHQRANNRMVATGATAFYVFYYVPSIVSIVIGLILSALGAKSGSAVMNTMNLVTMLIGDLIAVIICFTISPVFKHKIFATWKRDYKVYLTVMVLFIVITFALNLLFSYINQQYNSQKSANEASLETSIDIWYNAVILGVATILVAPFIEEMATRHGIFLLSGRPIVGYFVSIIYFAGMHVTSNGDWEQILSYLGASIGLASVFFMARYNVTYTIMTHMVLNIITFVLIMAHVNNFS